MKRFVCIFIVFFSAIYALTAQSSPPYNDVTIYFHSNVTRSQFDAITDTDVQRSVQNANRVIYKSFFELEDWDNEDDNMVDWIHENRILPGTRNNRQNGDMWELYVPRFNTDGWYILVRWSYDDGYTYRLFYYNTN